ncbi:hypothetical protein Q5752_005223 [Cryptotrichosporon argae]
MQNTAATGHNAAQWSSVMHPQQQHHAQHGQRNPSNPRYPSESTQPADDPYTHSAWYQNQSAQYGGYGATSAYNPTLPSSSRRTSNPKAATPPTSAPAGTTASPGYYPRQDVNSPATYQPSSAPAQVSAHAQQPSYSHYGGYYDYQNQGQGQYGQHAQQPLQTHQTHHQYSAPSQYAQQPVQQRQTSTGSVPADTRAQAASLDYNPQSYDASRYGYPQQQQQQQQQRQQPAGVWQGYPAQSVPGQATLNQYPWQPWQQQQQQQHAAYYQQHAVAQAKAASHMAPSGASVASAPAATTPAADTKVLGKRAADSGDDEPDLAEKKPSHKKKNKKDAPEPVVPKPPAKSKLHPPKQAHSAWQLFFTDELEKAKAAHAAANETSRSPGGTVTQVKLNVAQVAKDAGIAYANMSDELKRHYKERVEEGKRQYLIDKAAWEATLTPDDIKAENAFRAQQRKEGKSRKGNLKDPNAPKKPLSAYFLFLKGIRENDDLRRSVWAEETETTRQSVLAAERWRGLTDEEKKPYLTQAERDKQEYENLRKAYEEDAAARARGETVPERPYVDLQNVSVVPPPSLLIPKPKAEPADAKPDVQPVVEPDVKPAKDSYMPTPNQPSDPTFDEFPDFAHDSLGGHELDMGLDGLVDSDPQWLAGIMHDAPASSDSTSVAPTMTEALAQSADSRSKAVVPGVGEDVQVHSGQPTEETSDRAAVPTDDDSASASNSGSEPSEGAVGGDNV